MFDKPYAVIAFLLLISFVLLIISTLPPYSRPWSIGRVPPSELLNGHGHDRGIGGNVVIEVGLLAASAEYLGTRYDTNYTWLVDQCNSNDAELPAILLQLLPDACDIATDLLSAGTVALAVSIAVIVVVAASLTLACVRAFSSANPLLAYINAALLFGLLVAAIVPWANWIRVLSAWTDEPKYWHTTAPFLCGAFAFVPILVALCVQGVLLYYLLRDRRASSLDNSLPAVELEYSFDHDPYTKGLLNENSDNELSGL